MLWQTKSRIAAIPSTIPNYEAERSLYVELIEQRKDVKADKIQSILLIGYALTPGAIAIAVYGGHRCAREFGTGTDLDRTPFRREIPWFTEN